MTINRNEYNEIYVTNGELFAFPHGGGFWDVTTISGGLVSAWITKHSVRCIFNMYKGV